MIMSDFYVYAYIDPQDGTPFYIGKGQGKRAYRHLQPGIIQIGSDRGWFFYRKLRKLLARGIQPDVQFIHKTLTESQAFFWETFFIKALGRRDLNTGCLCNLTSGGEGTSGHQHSEETKKRMAISSRGQKHSEEAKQKVGNAHRGRKHTDKSRLQMSKGQRKRFSHPEEREKLRQALL